MRWIFAVSLFLLVNKIQAEDNEITEQPDKLDKNLRKALLRALSDLETDNDSNKVISGVQEAQTSTFSVITSDNPISAKTVTAPQIPKITVSISTPTPKATVSPRVTERTPATPPTPTTTTEESQAKVEDLQFFAAPLVAAFTVHQDELGLPKIVEPIFKESGQKTVSTKDIELERIKSHQQVEKKREDEKRKENDLKLQEYFHKQEQIRLQEQLEEKQKHVEQLLRTLEIRQKQEYILHQQQLLQEQQRIKLIEEQQHQKRLEEHQRQKLLAEQQRQQLIEEQKRNAANFNYNVKPTLSLQPAVTFQPQPEQYVDNTLQLQTKNYQNFQKPQFLYQQLPPTQNTVNFQTPFPNTIAQNYQPQSNRVFRHESGTGNFVNTNYNQVQPQSNRFFRSNPSTYSITPSINQDYHSSRYVRAPYASAQLNNLLYYSGIGQGKQQEDLNLISKVLAFNIHGDNYFPGSENVGQRLSPPRNYYIQS